MHEQMNVIGHDDIAIYQNMRFGGVMAESSKGDVNGIFARNSADRACRK